MAARRARRRHVQQALRFKDRNGQNRGGKRRGAGRPAKGPRSSERHKRRPELTGNDPILVTVRAAKDVGNLRRRGIYHALRFALYATALRDDFRVVHFSIQRTHLHMIVEARSKGALSRGMQGLLISAAKQINGAVTVERGERRSGSVFPDHYHSAALTTPMQVRNAIRYVLNNWRRHREDEAAFARSWLVDPFSSAVSFGGWKELEDSDFLFSVRDDYERLLTCTPQTWLLRAGWMKYGLIGAHDVPGPAPT